MVNVRWATSETLRRSALSHQWRRFLFLTLMVLGQAAAATAQQPPTRSADPAQIDNRLPVPTAPRGVQPSPPSTVPSPVAPADASFVLAGIVIDGATVFSPTDFTPLYEPLLGRTIDRDDVSGLINAITAKYRDAGYILTRVLAPAQDTALGLLRIEVLEGYVERVAFEGEPGGGEAMLQAYAERIRRERPLTMATLERYLLLISDLPGLSVRSGVAPIGDRSAAHELLLQVDRDPAEGYLALDNRGTRSVGPLVGQAAARLNSPLGYNETLTLRAFTVPDAVEELRFSQARLQVPVGDDGITVAADVWRSQIEAGGQLAPFDVESMENRAAVELAYPWLRSRQLSLFVNAQFEYRDSEQDVFGFRFFEDKVRSLRVGLSLYVEDDWGGATSASATFSRGLQALGASQAGDRLLSRADGEPQYTKLTVDLAREQDLPGQFSVRGWLTGQATGNRLLSSEEFRLGGGTFGRAYDPSELVGDEGVAAAVELRYDVAAPHEDVSGVQLFGFWDFGALWDDTLGIGTQRFSLASAGAGVRFTLFDRLAATLEVAKPLTRDVFEEGDKDWRAFFSLGLAL